MSQRTFVLNFSATSRIRLVSVTAYVNRVHPFYVLSTMFYVKLNRALCYGPMA